MFSCKNFKISFLRINPNKKIINIISEYIRRNFQAKHMKLNLNGDARRSEKYLVTCDDVRKRQNWSL